MGAVAAFGCLLLLIPLWSIFYKGAFSWHIQQPAAWQGALEALAVWVGLSSALLFLRGKPRWFLLLAVAWLYARRHGVDGAIAVNYLYLQGLVALGWPATRWVFKERPSDLESLVAAAFLGCMVWALIVWMGALAGIGSLRQIHWAALIMLGGAMVLVRPPQLASLVGKRLGAGGSLERVATALVMTLCLVMFAKASVSTDFDSIWYGLAADRVLVASGSLFSSEGLVGPVHYYPKLFESLQLALSGLGSITAIVGVSIMGWGLVLLTVNESLRAMHVDRPLRVLSVALIASMPALAGIGITAKGDTFGAWVIALSLLSLIRYRSDGDAAWFWLGVAAAMVAPLMRLTNIPYAAIALLMLGASAAVQWKGKGAGYGLSMLKSSAVWVVVAAVIVFALTTYRTFKLAGVFLIGPDFLVDLQIRMGLSVAFPAGRLQGGELGYLPWARALTAYVLDPRKYTGAYLQWIGNVWLFMLAAALTAGTRGVKPLRDAWPFAFMGLMLFPMLLCNKYFPSVGADGNYFISPVIALIVFGAVALSHSRLGEFPKLRAALGAALMAFASATTLIFFVVASWGPGTRPLDANFSRPLRDRAERNTKVYADYHMTGIAQFFHNMPPRTRVVGDIEGVGFWLPIRYEPMMIIGITRRSEVESIPETIDFLSRDKVGFLVLKHGAMEEADADSQEGYSKAMLDNAAARMRQRGELSKVFGDEYYEVWRVASSGAR